MFAFFWRALLFISALWLVQRLLALVLGKGKRQGASSKRDPKSQNGNRMVKDPICGMYLDPRLAVAIEKSTDTYYFCSQECRRKYLANPF